MLPNSRKQGFWLAPQDTVIQSHCRMTTRRVPANLIVRENSMKATVLSRI